MNLTFLNKILYKFSLLTLILALLSQCGLYKKTDSRKVPINAKDRVAKNLEEGKKISFFKGDKGSGKFEFASSNEMWRATVEILDFIPLANADYGGGVIITDWYSENNSDNDSVKIMVQFLSNEIRADGIKVTVYNRSCPSGQLSNCSVSSNENLIGQELKLAILKKAAELKTLSDAKKVEEYRKKNIGKVKPFQGEGGKQKK